MTAESKDKELFNQSQRGRKRVAVYWALDNIPKRVQTSAQLELSRPPQWARRARSQCKDHPCFWYLMQGWGSLKRTSGTKGKFEFPQEHSQGWIIHQIKKQQREEAHMSRVFHVWASSGPLPVGSCKQYLFLPTKICDNTQCAEYCQPDKLTLALAIRVFLGLGHVAGRQPYCVTQDPRINPIVTADCLSRLVFWMHCKVHFHAFFSF